MPAPSVVFGFLVATLYGSSFHFLLGGDARRLALLLLASWIGFALGQILDEVLALGLMRVGMVRFFTATIGAYTALIVVWVLTRRTGTP